MFIFCRGVPALFVPERKYSGTVKGTAGNHTEKQIFDKTHVFEAEEDASMDMTGCIEKTIQLNREGEHDRTVDAKSFLRQLSEKHSIKSGYGDKTKIFDENDLDDSGNMELTVCHSRTLKLEAQNESRIVDSRDFINRLKNSSKSQKIESEDFIEPAVDKEDKKIDGKAFLSKLMGTKKSSAATLLSTSSEEDGMELTECIPPVENGPASTPDVQDNMEETKCLTQNIKFDQTVRNENLGERTVNFKDSTMNMDLTRCETKNISVFPSKGQEVPPTELKNTDKTLIFKASGNDDMDMTSCLTQNLLLFGRSDNRVKDSTIHLQTKCFNQTGLESDMEFTKCITQNFTDIKQADLKRGSVSDKSGAMTRDFQPESNDMEETKCTTQNVNSNAGNEDRTINFKDRTGQETMDFTKCISHNISLYPDSADKKHMPTFSSEDDKTVMFKSHGNDEMEITKCLPQNISSFQKTTNHAQLSNQVENTKYNKLQQTLLFDKTGVNNDMEMTECLSNIDVSKGGSCSVKNAEPSDNDGMEMTKCMTTNISFPSSLSSVKETEKENSDENRHLPNLGPDHDNFIPNTTIMTSNEMEITKSVTQNISVNLHRQSDSQKENIEGTKLCDTTSYPSGEMELTKCVTQKISFCVEPKENLTLHNTTTVGQNDMELTRCLTEKKSICNQDNKLVKDTKDMSMKKSANVDKTMIFSNESNMEITRCITTHISVLPENSDDTVVAELNAINKEAPSCFKTNQNQAEHRKEMFETERSIELQKRKKSIDIALDDDDVFYMDTIHPNIKDLNMTGESLEAELAKFLSADDNDKGEMAKKNMDEQEEKLVKKISNTEHLQVPVGSLKTCDSFSSSDSQLNTENILKEAELITGTDGTNTAENKTDKNGKTVVLSPMNKCTNKVNTNKRLSLCSMSRMHKKSETRSKPGFVPDNLFPHDSTNNEVFINSKESETEQRNKPRDEKPSSGEETGIEKLKKRLSMLAGFPSIKASTSRRKTESLTMLNEPTKQSDVSSTTVSKTDFCPQVKRSLVDLSPTERKDRNSDGSEPDIMSESLELLSNSPWGTVKKAKVSHDLSLTSPDVTHNDILRSSQTGCKDTDVTNTSVKFPSVSSVLSVDNVENDSVKAPEENMIMPSVDITMALEPRMTVGELMMTTIPDPEAMDTENVFGVAQNIINEKDESRLCEKIMEVEKEEASEIGAEQNLPEPKNISSPVEKIKTDVLPNNKEELSLTRFNNTCNSNITHTQLTDDDLQALDDLIGFKDYNSLVGSSILDSKLSRRSIMMDVMPIDLDENVSLINRFILERTLYKYWLYCLL